MAGRVRPVADRQPLPVQAYRTDARTGSCRAGTFDAARYEGSDADERRLFYVAITRARDWLSVSRHERVTKQRVGSEPVLRRAGRAARRSSPTTIRAPPIEQRHGSRRRADLTITFSELAAFLDCGMAYRLRDLIGFQPRLAPELGYGKAVHHVLRTVAEATKATGRGADRRRDRRDPRRELLPADREQAGPPPAQGGRASGSITTYATKHEADLHRVWETERPFELHLDGVTVSGRADVILDKEGGVPTALAIVDYKTSTCGDAIDHALQLQVYADAGRREGLDVRGAYVHDLKATTRDPIPVDPPAVTAAEATAAEAAARIRARDYTPTPASAAGAARCGPSAARRSAERSDVEDLHHLVAIVVDHLDGDLPRLGPGEGPRLGRV